MGPTSVTEIGTGTIIKFLGVELNADSSSESERGPTKTTCSWLGSAESIKAIDFWERSLQQEEVIIKAEWQFWQNCSKFPS